MFSQSLIRVNRTSVKTALNIPKLPSQVAGVIDISDVWYIIASVVD